MKILNIIALLGLTTLPIVGCSKKENKPILPNENKTHLLNLSSAEITINKYEGVPIENIENLYYLDFSEEDKNELLNAPKWIKNQYGSLNNAYFYKNDNGWKSIQKLGINITDKIKFKGNKINLKLTRWKSIIKLIDIKIEKIT
ncbi:hypothetical protein [Spiroplasma endosymbiont of Asaphidion curtum]|uniref:hypothetical protein n=1 Tax=Spiroplasma endosymbiont of Asaphidion curtum TaxID=3066281 RepID=UPI00313B60B8